MIVRALMRDRKRIVTLLLALLIVGFSLPASFISGNTAPVRFIDEGLRLASPTLEFTVEVTGPANASLAERLAVIEKTYHNYTAAELPRDLVEGKGGVVGLTIALHAYFTTASVYYGLSDNYINVKDKEGRYVYSLQFHSTLTRGPETTPAPPVNVFTKKLIAVSPLSNDTRYLTWITGRIPEPGRSPLEAAVDERFASLMGWSLGETIDFLGIKAKIVGFYKYNGGLQGFRNSYPVLLVDKGDLLRLASMESAYIANLSTEKLTITMALLAGTIIPVEGRIPGIPNGTSMIIPWLPLNIDGLPAEYREYMKSLLSATIEGDFYADLVRSKVEDLFVHLSPTTMQEWRQTIDTLVYDKVAEGLGKVIEGSQAGIIVGSGITYYESYFYRVKAGKYFLAVTASSEAGEIIYTAVNQYYSGASIFALTVAVTTIFVLGWLTGSDLLKIIVGDWRPRLAVLVARGSSSKHLNRRLGLLLAILIAVGGVAGYLLALAIPLSEGLPVRLGLSRGILAATGGILFAVYLLLYRAGVKLAASIRPTEAIRPVLAIATARRSRKRVSLLAAAIVASSLLVGFYGGPDRIFESIQGTSPLVGILLGLVVMLGMLGIPIAPLLSSYVSATLIAGYSRLYRATARRVTRLAGVLARFAYASTRRLESRFLSGLLVPVMAGSLLMGVSLAIPALQGVASYTGEVYAGTGSFEIAARLASMDVAKSQLAFTALVSWVFLALSLYALLASVFALLESEVLVARIRGASPRQALGFVLGVLSQAGAHSFLASLGGAVLTWLVVIGVFNLIGVQGLTGSPEGMVWLARHSLRGWWPLAGLALAVATAFLVPLVVGFRVSRTRDLARVVREGGVA